MAGPSSGGGGGGAGASGGGIDLSAMPAWWHGVAERAAAAAEGGGVGVTGRGTAAAAGPSGTPGRPDARRGSGGTTALEAVAEPSLPLQGGGGGSRDTKRTASTTSPQASGVAVTSVAKRRRGDVAEAGDAGGTVRSAPTPFDLTEGVEDESGGDHGAVQITKWTPPQRSAPLSARGDMVPLGQAAASVMPNDGDDDVIEID